MIRYDTLSYVLLMYEELLTAVNIFFNSGINNNAMFLYQNTSLWKGEISVIFAHYLEGRREGKR